MKLSVFISIFAMSVENLFNLTKSYQGEPKILTKNVAKLRMKYILLFILLIATNAIDAQILKERRVYYLDCSYSMVTNKIWNEVCDNLKNAIDNVNEETTELVVIPFALGRDGGMRVMRSQATSLGKEKLKEQISHIIPSKSSMTFHHVPLQNFYKGWVDPTRVTYMFLMTDGQDEFRNKTLFPSLLKQWSTKFWDKNVYGFYVMLHKSAQNATIENICNSQKHLWKVETADINVNLVRVQNNAVFNVRNEKYFELPIYGNIGNMKLRAKFDKTAPYKVDKARIENGKFRVYVKSNIDEHMLPASAIYPLAVSMTGGGDYDFLVTDVINVKCERKPERSLKISVK